MRGANAYGGDKRECGPVKPMERFDMIQPLFTPTSNPSRNRGTCAAALLLVAALTGMAGTAVAQPAAAPDYEKLAAAVDTLEERLERVREAIDTTRFVPDELVFELEFEADRIVAFVRDEIAFHPYEGLLRGMRGTLMSRAGNSLDQSLLLAYLLKSAGLDARIVRGELDAEQTRQLLEQVRRAEPGGDLAPVRAAIAEQFGEEAIESGSTSEWDPEALEQAAAATSTWLRERLASEGVALDRTTLEPPLHALLKDYFWVEHRAGPGDAWLAVHPAFAGGPAPTVDPQAYMADEIDEQFHHTVTVEAWIRQRQGDRFENHRLMKPWTRPAANLHGVAISYRNHAGSITAETLADLEGALDDDEMFTPVFRGAPAPGGMAFDLKGRIIDPMAMGSSSFGAAGLFAELSDKMETATQAVDDDEDGEPLFALEAMWLEFTLTTPSGTETRYRRYLLAPGAHDASLTDKLWPLLTEHVYVVNTGDLPLDYLADRYLAAGSESTETYKALAHKLLRPEDGTPLPGADIPQDFAPLALYRMMTGSARSVETVAVRHVPAIVGVRNGLRDADTAFSAVDVIENRMLQLRRGPDGIAHDPSAALAQGVWETAIETVPGRLRPGAGNPTNAFAVFERARQQDIALRVIRPDGSLPASLSQGEATVLQHDLDHGYAVLLPERRPDGIDMTAWWRVHPGTGTTLGMTADGYGQDVVEYLIEVTGIAFNMVQAIGGLMACQKEADKVVQMCCLVEAHMNNVAGLGFGGYLGATLGTAGAAVFDIVNFGVQSATGESLGPNFKLQCDQFAGSGF